MTKNEFSSLSAITNTFADYCCLFQKLCNYARKAYKSNFRH